jgi:hypothetical protein
LAYGCGQLKAIDVGFCHGLSDICLLALSRGCGQLKTIDIVFCGDITDIGLSALGHGCGQLEFIDLSGNEYVSEREIAMLEDRGCHIRF